MQEAGERSVVGNHNPVDVPGEILRPGCESIQIHPGDLTFSDRASASSCLRDLNSFCFAPFPARLAKAMKADVVCHALEFCKEDGGQSQCRLHQHSQVSKLCSECHFPGDFRHIGNVIKGDWASFVQWFVD